MTRWERLPQARLARLLPVMHLLLTACALAFALAGSWWLAAGAYLATAVVRDLTGPPFHAWLNGSVTDSVAARHRAVADVGRVAAPASGAAARCSAWSATGTASGPRSRWGGAARSRWPGCSRGPSGTTASSPGSVGRSTSGRPSLGGAAQR